MQTPFTGGAECQHEPRPARNGSSRSPSSSRHRRSFHDDQWSSCVVHEHGVPSTFGVHDEDGSSSGAQGPHASVDVAERQLPNSFLRVPPSFKRTLLSSWLDKSWPYFPSMISFCLFMNQLGILNWVGFWMMVTIRSSSSGLSSPALWGQSAHQRPALVDPHEPGFPSPALVSASNCRAPCSVPRRASNFAPRSARARV